MPQQVKGEVLDVRKSGAYVALSLTAPGISDHIRPGHFVTFGIGGEETSMLLRRSFAVYQVQSRGVYGGTIEVVISPHGKGTRWLAERRRHDVIDIVGPLGTPFTLPTKRVNAVLVAGGYGAAAMYMLAEELRGRGCRVDVVVGAASEDKLFGTLEMKRLASSITITTDDGSQGTRGNVLTVLPEILNRGDTDIVYACGPMGMLAAVAQEATSRRIFSQTSVEEAMACGIGVCMTCVLPVIGDDGVTRMVRSCVEGPTFRGDRVRWADVGTVPADTWGAPTEVAR